MKQKKIVLGILLALVLLLGAAYLLYAKLGSSIAPNQLSAQGAQDSAGGTPDASSQQPQPVPAPDFTVYDGDGNGPCQMEMPDFQAKYEELGSEVQFLMINMTGGRETLDSAQKFIAEQGYTFPVFYDTDSDAAITYGAYSLPTTYFIDAEGNAVAQATGAINGEILQTGIDMIYTP